MKKLFSILLLIATFAAITPDANSQVFTRSRTIYSTLNVDTLKSVAGADTIFHMGQLSGNANAMIQLDVKRNSGTIAGKAYLYVSALQTPPAYTSAGLAGWTLQDSSAAYTLTGYQQLSTDTYTHKWEFKPIGALWYMVATYSSGTFQGKPVVTAVKKLIQ